MDTFTTLVERLAREEKSTFRYPDAAGPIEAKLPASKREAELRLWDEALARAVGSERPARGIALDAGCGDGAYLGLLADRFERVVALDADERRAVSARARHPLVPVFALDLGAKVFEEPALQGVLRFAQSMQVLGHLETARADQVLARLSSTLAPAGTLLLALPYTNARDDEFRISELDVAQSRQVGREEYDACVRSQTPGALPVRHFSMLSVSALLSGAQLAQSWCAPYGWLSYELADLMVLASRR